MGDNLIVYFKYNSEKVDWRKIDNPEEVLEQIGSKKPDNKYDAWKLAIERKFTILSLKHYSMHF